MTSDPVLTSMVAHLAELAIPSISSTIYTRVETITRGRANEQTVNELKQVINDLIKDRNDLVAIAQSFEQELVGQRLQDKDIKYIIDSVIPVLRDLVAKMPEVGATAAAQKASAEEALDILERLLSVEMLTVLQLVGFNYKRAIGEPLTLVFERLITSMRRPDPQLEAENIRLNAEASVALATIAQDDEATARFEKVMAVWRGTAGNA